MPLLICEIRETLPLWFKRSPFSVAYSVLPFSNVMVTSPLLRMSRVIVPPDCGFRVGQSTREWCPGEAFVFDDTIEHEAWNDSDRLRVVLIVDLWPPALTQTERAAVTRVIEAVGVSFGGA
jgi:hypothetical protein